MKEIRAVVLNTLQVCRQTLSLCRRACNLKYRCFRHGGKETRRLREATYGSHRTANGSSGGGAVPQPEPHAESCDFQSAGGYVCLFTLQTFVCGETVWKHTAAH